MPIKYFCDECNIEVSNPSVSLDMTGKILCYEHYQKYEESFRNKWNNYVIPHNKVWDKDRFKFPKGIRKIENAS